MGLTFLFFDQIKHRAVRPGRDYLPIHVSGQGVGEIFHEDGIIEIPAVGNGIDDGVGDGVGFEEAGSAIDADGFGGGRFRKPYPAGTRGDANAFDVRKLEDFFVRDFEKARRPGFAGERTFFDGTGADDVVRHALRGGRGWDI